MRLTAILAVMAILTPAALAAHPAASGLNASPAASDLTAAKKKKKPAPKKKTGENLKAAPGTGPSGPATKY